MNESDYIRLISSVSNRYGDKLLEFMNRYNLHALSEVKLEQLQEYWEHLKNREEGLTP